MHDCCGFLLYIFAYQPGSLPESLAFQREMESDLSYQLTVMKFGGTSIEDGPAFERVARIVLSSEGTDLAVVVSAMSGVTDALITGFRRAARGETVEALASLDRHFERHLKVSNELGSIARAKMRLLVEAARQEIAALLEVAAARGITSRAQDALVSHGERLAANLLTLVLEGYGIPASYVDARRCILTDEGYGSARPLLEKTSRQTRTELKPLLGKKRVPVLAGFIGAARNGDTTTLGRGSSDYSATLVSAALGARETQIWTDVDGVRTADPALVKAARTVAQLSYEEAAELARLGASVLHPKMIGPVRELQIPVRICNSRASEQSGTLICAESGPSSPAVKAIAHKTNLTKIDINATQPLFANGLLHSVREVFNRQQINMYVVAMSDAGVSLACEEDVVSESIVQVLKRMGRVKIERDRAMIGCVGEGLRNGASGAAHVRTILRTIDPSLIWQSTGSINLISVVDIARVGQVVRQIHQGIFERDLQGMEERVSRSLG